MKIGVVNTILYCRKWQETVSFYRESLELEITFSNEWFVEFKLSDTSRLSIADEGRASIDSSGGKGITISIEVDDIENTHSDLMNRRLKPTAIKDQWQGKVTYVHDPECNRLEFWAKSPASG